MMTEFPGMHILALITGLLSRLAAGLRGIPFPITFSIPSGILRCGFPGIVTTPFLGWS